MHTSLVLRFTELENAPWRSEGKSYQENKSKHVDYTPRSRFQTNLNGFPGAGVNCFHPTTRDDEVVCANTSRVSSLKRIRIVQALRLEENFIFGGREKVQRMSRSSIAGIAKSRFNENK